MMYTMSDEEVKLQADRVRELYMSAWTVDNLTACLMDMNAGGTGFHEETARAKAHKIVSWLKTIVKVDVPERREK
jgi:hypothetical protein